MPGVDNFKQTVILFQLLGYKRGWPIVYAHTHHSLRRSRPKGVAPDSSRIYVTDNYMDLIEVFNSDCRFQHVLGAKGKIRRLTAPGGIAIGASDRLFVAEMRANRVSVFGLR